MSPRFAPLAVALVLLVVAACSGPLAVAPTPAPTAEPPVVTPTPTPVPQTDQPTPPVTGTATPTPRPNAGDVDGWGDGPALTVELPGERLLDVTLEDAEAKAWRVVVAGVGDRAEDRFEVVVETGDVGPVITATEIQRGQETQAIDLSFYGDETAAAGGCHRTLEVCVDSSSFLVAEDGTGRLRVRLNMPDPAGGELQIRGGTAGWPGEPFVLGPWSDTEAFPWGKG